MSAFQIAALAMLGAGIAGVIYFRRDLDEFLNGIGQWTSDDAKAAQPRTGGVGAEIERPSEHNTRT